MSLSTINYNVAWPLLNQGTVLLAHQPLELVRNVYYCWVALYLLLTQTMGIFKDLILKVLMLVQKFSGQFLQTFKLIWEF
jgi:hypothetical protein